MTSKRIWLKKSRLYLVLDAQVNGYEDLLRIGCEAACAGVDILQLRDKRGAARQIAGFASELLRKMNPRIPLIINDRADVAFACGADGVHLGQDDLDVKTARTILGARAIVGRSCQTWQQARAAVEEGADYIGFGSVFRTQTKPERAPMDIKLLSRVIRDIDPVETDKGFSGDRCVPVFAIGGITVENIGLLRSIGVKRVAVTRALSHARNMTEAVKILKY